MYDRPYYGKKVAVIIPCKNRTANLLTVLPRWLEQIYPNYQIVIVDYGSKPAIYSMVNMLADRYQVKFDYNIDNSDAKIVLFRVDGCEHFNMSHAINYAAKRTVSDVISIAGTETLVTPYYLEVVMSGLSEYEFTRCHTGRLSFSRIVFERMNGYPESCEHLGNEEDFVSDTLVRKGLQLIDLNYFLAPNISHNYGEQCGQNEPRLICPQNDAGESFISRAAYPSMYGKKCTVLIPCMDRLDNLSTTLPMWINQLYVNKQIVIIDYSSINPIRSFVENLCSQYHQVFSYNEYKEDADVILFRIDNMNCFNISHAYNYAVQRIQTDVLSFVCADSCPRDYYLELCMNLVDEKTLIQCHWGLHTILCHNWKKLNGHQEFVVGWGGEDDDFRLRSLLAGLRLKSVSQSFVFHIPQNTGEKGIRRELQDINESHFVNSSRLMAYQAYFGSEANYGQMVGQNTPIEYVSITDIIKPSFLDAILLPDESYKAKLPKDYKVDERSGWVYLIHQKVEFNWHEVTGTEVSAPRRRFLLKDKEDVPKFLSLLPVK